MAVMILLPLSLGLLVYASTRSDWALVAFIALVLAVMVLMTWINASTQGWDGV